MHLEVRRLLEGGAYFDLIVKYCAAYLRPSTYKKKYNKKNVAYENVAYKVLS